MSHWQAPSGSGPVVTGTPKSAAQVAFSTAGDRRGRARREAHRLRDLVVEPGVGRDPTTAPVPRSCAWNLLLVDHGGDPELVDAEDLSPRLAGPPSRPMLVRGLEDDDVAPGRHVLGRVAPATATDTAATARATSTREYLCILTTPSGWGPGSDPGPVEVSSHSESTPTGPESQHTARTKLPVLGQPRHLEEPVPRRR